MATSRFLSLTYCQLVLVVVVVGASTLGSHRLWSPWQRHQTKFSLQETTVIMLLCANQIWPIAYYRHVEYCIMQAYSKASKIAIVQHYRPPKLVRQLSYRPILKLVRQLSWRPIIKLVRQLSCWPILKLYIQPYIKKITIA